MQAEVFWCVIRGEDGSLFFQLFVVIDELVYVERDSFGCCGVGPDR